MRNVGGKKADLERLRGKGAGAEVGLEDRHFHHCGLGERGQTQIGLGWLIRVQRKGCMWWVVEMRSEEAGGILSMEAGGITGTWGDWTFT